MGAPFELRIKPYAQNPDTLCRCLLYPAEPKASAQIVFLALSSKVDKLVLVWRERYAMVESLSLAFLVNTAQSSTVLLSGHTIHQNIKVVYKA